MDEFNGKRVTVLGLGRFGGGIGVSKWLVSQGATVTVTDRDDATKLTDSIKQLDGLPIQFHLGEEIESDFQNADLIVASPAVKLNHPMLELARKSNVPITTEIKLFVERLAADVKTVGVTGTKGKSTTSTLLARMLQTKFTTWLGGNIGGSLLADLPKIKPGDVVLLELSSYMLEHLGALKWSPNIAVVTMLATDHVAWHGSREQYIDAKRNIVRFQSREDFAVVGEEGESGEFANHTKARIAKYGLRNLVPFKLNVAGVHNQLNAQAAFVAANILGVSWDQAQEAILSFKGLTHRLQVVHESNGVTWVNDSIATIPEAAIAACEAFEPGKVIQIVGGDDGKKSDFTEMCRVLSERARAVLCIGEAGVRIATGFKDTRITNVHQLKVLPEAVKQAKSLAQAGDVVLLSTGCASYGEFVNFEERGAAFERLAKSL